MLGLVLLHSGKFLPKNVFILYSTDFVTVLGTEDFWLSVLGCICNIKGVLLLVVFRREDITGRHFELAFIKSPSDSCHFSLLNFFIAQ